MPRNAFHTVPSVHTSRSRRVRHSRLVVVLARSVTTLRVERPVVLRPKFAVPDTGGAVMRAVVCKEFGPPEGLVVEERPDPTPGPGEVLVDVTVSYTHLTLPTIYSV